MKRSKIVKFTAGLSLGLLIAALAAFNTLLIWVATGPRSLETLSPYITAALQPVDQRFKVNIGETWLIWDGWQHPIDIRLRNVAVVTKEGEVFSTFPEISLGVDMFSLPFGRILPTSLSIIHPILSLYQNEDRSISFGFTEQGSMPALDEAIAAEQLPFSTLLEPLLSPRSDSNFRKLELVNIRDADISVGNVRKGVFFQARNVDILLKRSGQGAVQISTGARIDYEEYHSDISAKLSMSQQIPTIDGTVEFTKLRPGTLAKLFADNSVLQALNFPVSGKGQLTLSKEGDLQRLFFVLDGSRGSIKSDRLDGIIPVTAFHAEGQVNNNAKDIQINKLTANMDGTLLAAAGVISLMPEDISVRGNVSLQQVPGENVRLFWPQGLAPMTREWVLTNITGGVVPEASAKINIQPGDLAKAVLPKEAVDANIQVDGVEVQYLEEHPKAKNVKGVIHVDGVSLDTKIVSADYMASTKMSNGSVLIADLNADNPHILVNFDAETSAKDVVHFLGLPRLKHAKRLNLTESVEGNVKGSVSLGFDFFAPRDEVGNVIGETDVDFSVQAELKNITQAGFMNKFDISQASGNMTVTPQAIDYTGSGTVNGASASAATVKYLFQPENNFDTFIDVKAIAPVESLPKFGYTLPMLTDGSLVVEASLKQGANVETSKVALDLTGSAIRAASIGWEKPVGQPATLDMATEKKDGVLTISQLHLKGKDIEAKGKATLNKEMTALSRIELNQYRFGATDLDSVTYAELPGGYALQAAGAVADVSHHMQGEEGFSFEHFPAMQLKLDIGRVITGGKQELVGVKGALECDIKLCSQANMTGKTGEKPFAIRILRNPKGKRQLSIRAENAGAFLQAMDIFDGMEGGDLTITGNYDDSGPHSVLNARMDINEHVIKDAPILAKILSLASLTGFFDTLQGNGIRFKKLAAPFTLANDVITFEKAKTYGSAIGMTAQGTITMPKTVLAIEGTVVPSYSLNSVLGKVPIVGQVLTGGEGQGVFAASYSVKGTDKDPEVSVNPLSILTPGFLRGLFDS